MPTVYSTLASWSSSPFLFLNPTSATYNPFRHTTSPAPTSIWTLLRHIYTSHTRTMLMLFDFVWSLKIPLIPLILAASILMMPKHGTHLLYYGWLGRLIGLTLGSYIFFALAPWMWKIYLTAAVIIGFWRWRQYWILYDKLSRTLPMESIQSVPNAAAMTGAEPPSPELEPHTIARPPNAEFRRAMKRTRSVARAIADVKNRALSGLSHPCLNHTIGTRDGITLHYQTIGEGSKLIFVGNGLGGRIYYFEPIIKLMNQKQMFNDYTLISWDYRGLFESSNPEIPGRQSVRDNAEDVIEILRHFKSQRTDKSAEKIACFLGWSTGVQVGLELVTLYPQVVEKLVLLNGSHGHTLQSAFQPVFRIPWLGGILHDLLTLARTRLTFLFGPIAKWISDHPNEIRMITRVYAMVYGNPHMEWMLLQYITDILGISESHTKNYLKIFQTLDAHSCQHLLPEIQTPTLVICGMMDNLTPAYQSYEMARQMPNARVSCYTFSSHFTILEFPYTVSNEILSFMFEGEKNPPKEPWPVAAAIPVPTAKVSGAEIPLHSHSTEKQE